MRRQRKSARDVFVLGEEALEDSPAATAVVEGDGGVGGLAEERPGEESDGFAGDEDDPFYLGAAVDGAGGGVEMLSGAPSDAVELGELGRSSSPAGADADDGGRRPALDRGFRAPGARVALVGGAAVAAALALALSQPRGEPSDGGRAAPEPPSPTVAAELPEKTIERESRSRRTRGREHEQRRSDASPSPAAPTPLPSRPVAASPSPPPEGGGSGGGESFGFEQ
jgi:hypothetical protein